MKKNGQKKSLTVSNSRWLAYATAGAATALGAIPSGEAEIHYSGLINGRFGGNGYDIHLRIPLGHSARLRFAEYTYQLFFAIEGAADSNSFCGYVTSRFGSRYVSRLHRDEKISNCDFFRTGATMLVIGPFSMGPFCERGIGYIGFRFNNGAGMQYGWARLNMPGPPYARARFELVDYAWGDPGDRIKAGQTSSAGDQAVAIPDQGSLGLLALGGAGLMAWRRRRLTARL
jgi:hypothetical protein